MSLRTRSAISRALAMTVAGLLTVVGSAAAQTGAADDGVPSLMIALGKIEYDNCCAACHGAKARGSGPVADVLTTEPTDLTQLTKRFSGSFPEEYVYEFIDGRRSVTPHGEKQMPLWGDRYNAEAYARAQDVPHEVDAQAMVIGRISSLVQYLRSIQAE